MPDARKMERISFDELLEMTANGCPKPAMRSVEYARTHGVDLHVRSSFTWEPGTLVTKEEHDMEQAIISAVVHDTDEAKVTVAGVPDQPGIAGRLFRALADRDDQRRHDRAEHLRARQDRHLLHRAPRRRRVVAARCARPWPPRSGPRRWPTDVDIARVSVVGAGMKSNPGVAATVFETLAAAGINIEMISTSAIRISCVVRQDQVEQAVQVLHDAFGLADARPR